MYTLDEDFTVACDFPVRRWCQNYHQYVEVKDMLEKLKGYGEELDSESKMTILCIH